VITAGVISGLVSAIRWGQQRRKEMTAAAGDIPPSRSKFTVSNPSFNVEYLVYAANATTGPDALTAELVRELAKPEQTGWRVEMAGEWLTVTRLASKLYQEAERHVHHQILSQKTCVPHHWPWLYFQNMATQAFQAAARAYRHNGGNAVQGQGFAASAGADSDAVVDGRSLQLVQAGVRLEVQIRDDDLMRIK
jgi:hypothetical protein